MGVTVASRTPGIISASLIIVILVGAAVGALVALFLQGAGLGPRTVALISGFIAVLVATVVRYKLIVRGAGVGPDESRIPGLIVTYAAVASIAGSLAAHDLYGFLAADLGAILLGALAGLLSAILMGMLMVTYHTNSQAV